MEYLKVTRVDRVKLHRRGRTFSGTLHLTTYHLIFTLEDDRAEDADGGAAPAVQQRPLRELWCSYSMIERVELRKGSALLYRVSEEERAQSEQLQQLEAYSFWKPSMYRGANLKLCCRDYNFLSFDFADQDQCHDVYESILRLTCIDRIDKCYAFLYKPIGIEAPFDSWKDYNARNEFERQGVDFGESGEDDTLGRHSWRITSLNEDYSLCPSYPSVLCVPRSISDTILTHTVRFRSKSRFPALVYYYKKNGCSIVRCAQPLVGIKQNRSFQDEKMVYEVFRTNGRENKLNLMVDARPVTNAMAQVAMGAGTESMDNYGGQKSRKLFLGLENIHTMRESIGKVKEVLKNGDVQADSDPLDKDQLARSGWLEYVSKLLWSTDMLVKWIHLQGVHIVIHCSDGWDRTPQVTSLVQICIDPYFRTLEGFVVLVEKDWCSFGHRFNERCGHLQKETKFYDYASETNFQRIRQLNQAFKHHNNTKFESPIFQQFLDCVYQLLRQHPTEFEYNERFLRRVVYHVYSCQYGTFLQDTERERKLLGLEERTRSVWDYFKARKPQFTNPDYKPAVHDEVPEDDFDYDKDVLYPNFSDVVFWHQLYGKRSDEMNPSPTKTQKVEAETGGKVEEEKVPTRLLERLEIS